MLIENSIADGIDFFHMNALSSVVAIKVNCIGPGSIDVRFQKRAHNPLLLAAGFQDTNVPIPWLGGKKLCLAFR